MGANAWLDENLCESKKPDKYIAGNSTEVSGNESQLDTNLQDFYGAGLLW